MRLLTLNNETRREAIGVFVSNYFTNTLNLYGMTARGADWRDDDAQTLRFEQLLKILPAQSDSVQTFTLVDYGCGYGAFLKHLDKHKIRANYLGIDCTKVMVETSSVFFKERNDCRFICSDSLQEPTDYTVVSGTFNYKDKLDQGLWQDHVLACLDNINEYTCKGIAFNLLTSYSDADKMRDHLFYANPGFFFDYCKKNYAKNVTLLHDYGAYEFTILVRK